MGCRTFSLLVAAVLISLLTNRLPVACARHVAVLKMNNGLNSRGEDLAKEPALGSADDFSVKKGFEGRKLGGRNMDEAEVMGVKGEKKAYGEKADVSHHKTKGSQMQQQGPAESTAAAARRPASSRPRTVEMRTAGKHTDPTTEIYDMLRKDYASRASRRRPINNGQPLQEEP